MTRRFRFFALNRKYKCVIICHGELVSIEIGLWNYHILIEFQELTKASTRVRVSHAGY